MAGIPFKNIYLAFITRYLGDTQVTGSGVGAVFTPDLTDPEWQIAIQHYNTAVRQWNNADGELWDVLWTQLSAAVDGTKIYTSGTSVYAAPSDVQSFGGFITLGNASNPTFNVPLVSPELVQNYTNSMTPFAYHTGNAHTGFSVVFNMGAGDSQFNGATINYPYYKKPTYLAVTEDGSTVAQIPDIDFIVNSMLAQRYLEARNYPAYQVADRAATQALANMEVRNTMGAPNAPWTVADRGPGWGNSVSRGFGW